MSNRRCSKSFPKKFVDVTSVGEDGYPIYRRRDNGRIVMKAGVELDNRYVVPHNRYLLLKYGAHINVEWCNQSRSIKYLFKYVNKGNDRVTASFYQSATDEQSGTTIDEVKMYYDCRYVSPCEAVWRILGFEIQYRYLPVECLSFHLPNEQSIYFDDDAPINVVVERHTVKHSMFLAWLEANKKYPEAKQLTYAEMPTKFVWKQATREFVPRQRGFSIGRVFYVPPGSGEMYYLRCLLNAIRGPTCYEDLRTINGVLYDNYHDACYALGLLENDKEYVDGIVEASQWATAGELRNLFTTLLSSNCLSRPEVVWEKCWTYMSDDILYKQRNILNFQDLVMSVDEIKNQALVEIEKFLKRCGKSLHDYLQMPIPDLDCSASLMNRLVYDEMCYDKVELKEEHKKLVSNLALEQHDVYNTIMNDVNSNQGGVFFVYGYGGTGKTFVWRTLSAALRSKGEIVLNVASGGIASLLLPGGRIAHSRFAIPLNPNEDSACNIKQGSQLAELIIKCKLII